MIKRPKIIVVGSGLAGLFFSIKLARKAPDVHILMTTKDELGECNSRYASGGIAASHHTGAKNGDNIEKHYDDTIKAGCGLNDRVMVAEVVSEAPSIIRELISYGVEFDLSKNRQFDLHLEGGHSMNRIFHKKDETGLEIINKLLGMARSFGNIEIKEQLAATDLLIDIVEGVRTCKGVSFFDRISHETLQFGADVVVLATGGAGQVYGCTTNSIGATGDGIAMAKRAGAKISDMEFIQFHPTALFEHEGKRKYLITEAIRGNGAKIVNEKGEAFLERTVEKAELAPRHMVSQAIANELKNQHTDHVYLDCSGIDAERLQKNFTSFWRKCTEINLNPTKEKVPVVPAAHFICGGIEIERDGSTSIPGLFALGECANSGMHGANRLASNSLLEAIVVANNCSALLSSLPAKTLDSSCHVSMKSTYHDPAQIQSLVELKMKLNEVMDQKVGVLRNRAALLTALKEVDSIDERLDLLLEKNYQSNEAIELSNLILIAKEIITSSLARKESVGCFILDEKKDFDLIQHIF